MPISDSEQRLLVEAAVSLNRLFAINFYGRSGTILLQSLFDGHPEVIVMPGHFFEFFYSFFAQHQKLDGAQLIAEFLDYFNVLFDGSASFKPCQGTPYEKYCEFHGFSRLGVDRNQQPMVDKEIFAGVMSAIVGQKLYPVDRKLFLQSAYLAYWRASGRDDLPSEHTYLLFPLHNHDAAPLLQDFAQAKFIVMTREPIDCAGSFFKYAPEAAFRLLEHIFFAGAAPVCSPESVVAVRLEDLHNNARPTMELVCRWLQICWNDCLLQSTFQGLLWWGENKSKPMNGLSPGRPVPDHREVLFEIDRWRLKVLLFRKAQKWQYEFAPIFGSGIARLTVLPLLLLPLKIELTSYATWRKQVVETSLQKLPQEGFLRLLKLICWWCGLGLLQPWWRYRKLLWRAWLQCGKESSAAPLLVRPPSS